MRVTPILATLASANIASAMLMRIAAGKVSWSWTVTGWSAGCAETCHYDFNVTGIGNSTDKPPSPSFKAYCSGEGEGADFKACTQLEESETRLAVKAKLLPNNNSTNGSSHQPQIQVSLQYIDLKTESTWWNFTGQAEASYNQLALMNFTITPDTIYGVA
ncbi:hypothetical protein F4821DRAFT_225262 [Hypoxylon rubiginosum]|uniref:Uncharacterized protein n=1 Tax=Hypoxylon rubiginosum TaxID=110542 RepID=A0ACC0DJB1_9PEZI|nr:hypothetical protein F4821DRAFT_225262 [Hypoxylon rubiginosum]